MKPHTVRQQPVILRLQALLEESLALSRAVLDNTFEDVEQNRLNGRIILVPTRAVEFISIDFIITNSGVSFE